MMPMRLNISSEIYSTNGVIYSNMHHYHPLVVSHYSRGHRLGVSNIRELEDKTEITFTIQV